VTECVAGNDIYPPPYKNMKNPNHMIALVAMGLYILDNADLERLSEECEKRNKYEFMIIINTLPLQGATGSPVNPIAMF
jgi:hypothetical protein